MSGEPETDVAPSSEWNGRGEKQESRCRDPVFAVVFYIMFIAIIALAVVKGPDAFNADENAEDAGESADYSGYAILALVVFVLSLLTSALLLHISMTYPDTMIKTSLYGCAALFLLAAIANLMVNIFYGFFSLLFFGIFCCWCYCVWSRIPFASANLVTAATACKSNSGLFIYAYAVAIAGGVFQIIWTIAAAGVLNDSYDCDDEVCNDPNIVVIFLLLLAFYFSAEVFKNTMHVTVAGTVGTWWFSPDEASGVCSPAVNDSFLRATTTSFGSICFGSLLVAILNTLEQMARQARQNGDGNAIVLCLVECILSCLSDLLEYFNKWAYVYVGLYGYSYLQAGKNVIQLFKNKGFELIIADTLVDYLCFFVSLVCGLAMSIVGFGLGSSGMLSSAEGDTGLIGALMGLLIGYLVCSILMLGVISSSVNTVIVLVAEAPAEFAENYPDLSQRMFAAWRQVYGEQVAFAF